MAFSDFVHVGDSAEFRKTLTDTDVAMFCAISGDFDPVHVDAHHAAQTVFGARIAHGVLSMASLSTVAAMISRLARDRGFAGTPVSLGYDRIRFLKPVFVGDTLVTRYTVLRLDEDRERSHSSVQIANQRGDLVLAGEHIMKWTGAGARSGE